MYTMICITPSLYISPNKPTLYVRKYVLNPLSILYIYIPILQDWPRNERQPVTIPAAVWGGGGGGCLGGGCHICTCVNGGCGGCWYRCGCGWGWGCGWGGSPVPPFSLLLPLWPPTAFRREGGVCRPQVRVILLNYITIFLSYLFDIFSTVYYLYLNILLLSIILLYLLYCYVF
jgi:hypothetical protein